MKFNLLFVLALCVGSLPPTVSGQTLELKSQNLSNPDNEPAPVHPLPHPRQLKWQETEFYAFFHYGMNTYTGVEWGSGSESERQFAPTAPPNPRQWLETIKKYCCPVKFYEAI